MIVIIVIAALLIILINLKFFVRAYIYSYNFPQNQINLKTLPGVLVKVKRRSKYPTSCVFILTAQYAYGRLE